MRGTSTIRPRMTRRARAVAALTSLLSGCGPLIGIDDLTSNASPDASNERDVTLPDPPPPPADAGPDVVADADAAPPALRVFVSSTAATGALGGLPAADMRCQERAKSAGLGGQWTAWLSGGGVNAIDRIAGEGPWYLVSGDLVVASRAKLRAGELEHAVDRDEDGASVADQGVWTGTDEGEQGGATCDGWTSAAPFSVGRAGSTSATTDQWTSAGFTGCNLKQRLYCFEAAAP